MDVQLQDTEKFNNIERLFTRLFDDDTKDVKAGEIVSIIGVIDIVKKNEGGGNNNNSKYINVLYSKSIEYSRENKIELTHQDVKELKA